MAAESAAPSADPLAAASAVEVAAAAAGVPLLDPVAAVDGFAAWLPDAIDHVVEDALARGAAPGAAVVLGHRGKIVLAKGWGRTDRVKGAAEVTDATVWDLASVTKVAATTIAAMVLVQDGALDLDAPVHTYLPAWPADGARGQVTVRELLHHNSGLRPGAVAIGKGGREGVVGRLARVPMRSNPGGAELYGDLNMVLLGAVIEAVAGEPLDQLLARRVYRPLGMAETTFRPLAAGIERGRIAATEKLGDGRPLQGIVHDPIARDLGGVAGNAGLFSSARDLGTLASSLLWEVPARLVCRAVVNEFTQPVWGDQYALGWESATADTSWGDVFTRGAYGHTGYTGTSLWIDPDLDLFVVLLTNRVNPSALNQKHLALRRDLHDTVVRALVDAPRSRAGTSGPPVADGCLAERVRAGLARLPPLRWPR
jgi:CubicO group peptidase (beta-lactamase class C family)